MKGYAFFHFSNKEWMCDFGFFIDMTQHFNDLNVEQQLEFTSNPCFMHEWNSRVRNDHNVKKSCPLRPGERNITFSSLIPTKKVLLPLLHIKLELAMLFVKAMR